MSYWMRFLIIDNKKNFIFPALIEVLPHLRKVKFHIFANSRKYGILLLLPELVDPIRVY